MTNWLDGAIAGLGAAAVCAAFAFHSDPARRRRRAPSPPLTNLAYPIGDVLLLGLVVGGFAVLSGPHARRPWFLLASGIALNVVGDTSNLLQHSFGATASGSILNAIAWPTAIVLMSMAVWLRRGPSNPLVREQPTGFVLPSLAAAAALALLFVGTLHPVGRVAARPWPTATLVVVGIRLVLSVRDCESLSQERHRQADHRRADRALEPAVPVPCARHLLRRYGQGPRRPEAWPSSSSTSTASRRSTTPSATPPATSCSGSWGRG